MLTAFGSNLWSSVALDGTPKAAAAMDAPVAARTKLFSDRGRGRL